MANDEWEDVEVPRGSYISWGEVGQSVTIEVVSYSPTAGSGYNNEEVPEVVGILMADAINYRKGVKETLSKGEFVTITCSQANINKAIRAAVVEPGNLVRITFEDTYKTDKGDGKSFKVQVNRHGAPGKVDAGSLV